MAAFSFYPGKNLGACGEGGAFLSSDAKLLTTVRKLREHGQAEKYYHDIEGYNGRLDSIQAAFLRIKLRKLEQWNEARRRLAGWYRERLAELPDVAAVGVTEGATPVYHLFVIQVPDREKVREFLQKEGVATGLHYPLPLHQQKAYKHLGQGTGSLPVTEDAAGKILSLPMFPEMRLEQVEFVVDSLGKFFSGRRAPRVGAAGAPRGSA